MDSRCNESFTEDNATKVFELIITNPCSEPSEPVEISCVFKDLTAKTNALDKEVSKDGFTDSEPIVIDDLDNEEVTTTDEKSSKDDAQKSIEANKETSNNVKESIVNIMFECNDNQKESTESVIILDETNTDDLNQTKFTSGQLVTEKVYGNDNVTTDSDLDLYETELQNALNANKTNSGNIVLDKPPLTAVDTDTGKCKQTEKAVCSDNIAKKDDPKTDSDIDFYETESQNVVTLNGKREDSDVILIDSKISSDNTTIQDDNEITVLAKEYPPIDLVAEEDLFSHNKISEGYAEEFKKNSILTELVQKCLNMERNGGMRRVINRTLLNIYKSVDEEYKKSVALRKVITRTIMKLHMEPELKFSHIKCLCDHLKLHMVKKRVPFVTLEKRSTGDESTSTIPSKKRRLETIDLDNYAVKNQTTAPSNPKEYPPIEIEDSSSGIEEVNNVIVVDNEKAKKKKPKRKKKKKRKGGLARTFIPTLVRNPFCTIPDPSLKEIPTSNETERLPVIHNYSVSTHKEPKSLTKLQTVSPITQIIDSREEPQINSQSLLTPVVMEPVPLNSGNSGQLHNEAWKASEIEKIEEYIAYLREQIENLEEMEVQVDDVTSPYIISEQYQSILVKQYKRLCELTGTQEKKQHKVRLQVLPGHPEAPVRYLQEFLNDNIDEEGNPPFPDLYDVIECVSRANDECHMNWGQAQIMKEARSLFIQFGQTMQKRRQKREWKDLMSRVKEEVNDPAEQDVELMMKLNRNSWIAKQNENALLDRYASLEQTGLSVRIANELSVGVENGVPEPETDSSDDENANPRVPYSSIKTYERQKNVGSSMSVTNGSIGIPTTNEKQNGSLVMPATCDKQKIVGSAISLSNGCIEITPTYDLQKTSIVIPNTLIPPTPFQLHTNNTFGVASIQNATNTFVVNGIQSVTTPEIRVPQVNDDLNMYSLEFQNFTLNLAAGNCNLCTGVKSHVCFHNTNVSTVNNRNVGTVNNSNVTTVNNRNVRIVNSNVSTVNNNVSPFNNSNVTTVNNSNVGTVNSNVSTVNNRNVRIVNSNVSTVNNNVSPFNNSNVTTVNSDEVQSKVHLETATNLAKTIMELVQKDIFSRASNGNKNTKEFASSHNLTPKSTDAKVKEEPEEKTEESVCDIFTHKTKPTNKNTVNENTESKETTKCIETKTDKINVSNQSNVETSSEIETKDNPIEDIVKPEPLDIPRMLAELGEDYTAEVFDIEDPFLVIEISDSSDSEDEDT